MKPKMFVFLSGPRGVGKTTQQQAVYKALQNHFKDTSYHGHLGHQTSFKRQMFKYIISHPDTPKEVLFYAHKLAHFKVDCRSKVNKDQMADALMESAYFQRQEWKTIPMRKLFQGAEYIPYFDLDNKFLDLSPREFMIHMSEHRAKVLKGKDVFAKMLVHECETTTSLVGWDVFICDTLAFPEEFDYLFEHTPHYIYQIYMEFSDLRKNNYDEDSRYELSHDFFNGIRGKLTRALSEEQRIEQLKRVSNRAITRGKHDTEKEITDYILTGLVPAIEKFIHRHENQS